MPEFLRQQISVRRLGWLIIVSALFWPSTSMLGQSSAPATLPKYVFLFLSDGAGMAHLEIARQYRRQILNEGFVIVDKIMKDGNVRRDDDPCR